LPSSPNKIADWVIEPFTMTLSFPAKAKTTMCRTSLEMKLTMTRLLRMTRNCPRLRGWGSITMTSLPDVPVTISTLSPGLSASSSMVAVPGAPGEFKVITSHSGRPGGGGSKSSSSAIVRMAVDCVPSVAPPVGLLRAKFTVSFGSSFVSLMIGIVKV
jgi:hypothetical protein